MNHLPHILLDGHTLVVSPSQFETIETCAEKWHFKYVQRREESRPAGSLVAGGAFDAALNHRYTKLGNAPCDDATQDEMEALIDAEFASVDLPLDEYRTPARFKAVMRLYNETWKAEPFRIRAVQLPFAVELGRIPVPSGTTFDGGTTIYPHPDVRVLIHGILDLLIEWQGGIWVCDTKTMNDWGPRKLSEWENAPQPMCYAWGMQRLAIEHPELGLPPRVHGFALNAVVVRPPAKTERAKLPREEFHRHTFPYTPERLDEWRQDALDQIENVVRCAARGRYTHTRKSCANHYGRACPYLDVCTLPKSQRMDALGSDLFQPYRTADVFAAAQTTTTIPQAL